MNEIIQRFEAATKIAAAAQCGLTKIPTMDAQAILKLLNSITCCKDCANFNFDNMPAEGCGYCNLLERTFFGDDYCSQAVRK